MSGIAALLGANVGREAVETMLTAAPHRGNLVSVTATPKGSLGIQRNEGEDPFLGAASWAGQNLVVIVHGCLYSGPEIAAGEYAARRIGDTLQNGGPEALARLHGSFAIVALDRATGEIVAYRSPVGERPLFWRRQGRLVAFASEVKQLICAPLVPPPTDEETVLNLVAAEPLVLERTTYRSVTRLLPGRLLHIRGGVARERRFWSPHRSVGTARIPFPEAVRELRRLLEQAVSRRLRDGTCVLMSGGLDSTAVAAVAAVIHRRRYASPLHVVSAAYPRYPRVDESASIAAAVNRLGAQVHWVRPRPGGFRDLEDAVWLHDGPDIAAMSWNFRQILSAGRREGLSSCLDGHDGDTAFGTPAGVVRALLHRGRFPTLFRFLSFSRRRRGVGTWAVFRHDLLPVLAASIPILRTMRRRPLGEPLLPIPAWVGGPLRLRLARPTVARDWFEHQADLVGTSQVLALEHLERMAMAEGISLAHPLSDPELLEFLLSLPPEVKFAGGRPKALARRACPELPPEVVDRVGKTLFDDVALAGARSHDILEQVHAGPRVLPGVDWRRLESRLEEGEVLFPERGLLHAVLSADRFLGSR